MPTRAMQLTTKGRDVDSFVESLKSEGENVVAPVANKPTGTTQKMTTAPPENMDLYVFFFLIGY